MTARTCSICGEQLPPGRQQAHWCQQPNCSWFKCPCGKTWDLTTRNYCKLPGKLRDETKGQK